MGVNVAYNGVTVRGILDDAEGREDQSGFGLLQRSRSVLVETAALADLVSDTAITVDGVAFVVRDFTREAADGALTRIVLAVDTEA
jgi:hypothetical protein